MALSGLLIIVNHDLKQTFLMKQIGLKRRVGLN